MYGFGGIPKYMGIGTSHCFPLNGLIAAPGILGVENIIAAYKQTLPQI